MRKSSINGIPTIKNQGFNGNLCQCICLLDILWNISWDRWNHWTIIAWVWKTRMIYPTNCDSHRESDDEPGVWNKVPYVSTNTAGWHHLISESFMGQNRKFELCLNAKLTKPSSRVWPRVFLLNMAICPLGDSMWEGVDGILGWNKFLSYSNLLKVLPNIIHYIYIHMHTHII